ncbi:MAG: hypothetical protein GWN58_36360, partial [Anaerolineae bacterium]|nr:hypothetical protein [Anaerolineae bacterium]
MQDIRRVKAEYNDVLLGKRNVVACGVGYKEVDGVRTDELAVIVSVARKLPRAELTAADLVPQTVAGVQT